MLDEIAQRHAYWQAGELLIDGEATHAIDYAPEDRAWLLTRLREAERLLRQYKTMCDLNRVPDPAIDAWLDSLHREEADL